MKFQRKTCEVVEGSEQETELNLTAEYTKIFTSCPSPGA